MSTQPTSTLEQLDLSDFEFDLPCQIVNANTGDDCPKAGEWTLVYRNHCSPGNADTVICTPHRDYLMTNGNVTCGTCKTVVQFLPYLIRIERIRP